jgi:LytS/YehU family sensor histidine kinase
MLRYQLNPHFLFNTLNSISTLVLLKQTSAPTRCCHGCPPSCATPGQRADRVGDRRAGVETLKLYLEIEKMRFEDPLAAALPDRSRRAQARLPSLLLQPLVENAIKYAVTPQEDGADIIVDARGWATGWSSTSSTRAGRGQRYPVRVEQSTGVGLANIRDRLAQAYGADHRFETQTNADGGFSVTIEIPYQIQSGEET